MLLYFFIGLGTISLGGIVAVTWRQLTYVRANYSSELALGEEYLGEIFQLRIDSFYDNFAYFFKHFVHYACLHTLLALRRVTVISRFLLTRVEKKFSRLIDSVHGRGVLAGRGPVSPFLTQLKEPKQ